jgi:ribose transport system substrate-binding protein
VVVAPSEATPEAALASQLAILSEQRDNGYNALGVAPMAADVSTEIAAFADFGAPVVTIDGDLAESRRDLYIGTINREAGETSAETLLELMPATSGTIVLLGHDTEEWPDGYQRTMGAKELLEQRGFQTIVRRTTWADGGIPLDVASMKENLETADPPVVGMLGLFSAAYRCAMAAEEAGKTGDDVTIVGFDFEPETVQYMQSGLIKATHAQRQYYMGYLVPYVLYSVDVLGLDRTRELLGVHMVDGSRFNAGLDVVKPNQLDEYNDFLDSLGIGG